MRTARVWRGGLLAAVCVVVALGAAACEKPDWTSPAYLSQQIKEGDRLRALDELAKLPREKQVEVVPALIDAYNNNLDKERAFDLLAQLRDKQALNVYVDALRNGSSNAIKGKAATALGDLKATEHIGDLLELFKSVPNEPLRRSVLEALKQMPDPQVFGLVTEILTVYDPDREPIAYHSYACDIMAEVDSKQMTDSVVQALVYGMFLDNATGQNVYKECATAVFNAGKRATPELLKVVKGEHEKVNKRFARYSSYVAGTNEIKAADVLGLIRDPAAFDDLAAFLVTKRQAPVTYTEDKKNQWLINQVQLFVYAAGALADIGLPKSADALEPFVKLDPKAYEPYQESIEGKALSQHDMFLAGADGLNTIGDRGRLPVLLEAARKADMPSLKRYGDEGFVFQPRWEAARAFARLGRGDDLEAYDKLIAEEKVEGAKAEFQKHRPMLVVAQECRDQVACYGRYLTGDKKAEAEKAAWELGRLEGGEAELLKGLGVQDLELRRGVVNSLYRVGGKATMDKITEVLAAEKDRATPEFKDSHFKLRALRAFLRNKG
jgi:HEAT repeat protein